jgi:putative membrane protein
VLFRTNRLHQALLGWYLLLWTALAISPVDRHDWLLENLLAFIAVGLLAATYRKAPFSDLSYILITVFMSLHAVGAHYTYAQVPFGFWLQEAFDLSRNHFDRLAHFAFGLLLGYPIREVLMRRAGVRKGWGSVLAVLTVMAFSDSFEVIESWVAQIVSPELGSAYLGTQGDEWDAQKDTTAATAGGVLGMLLTAAIRHSLPPRLKAANP